MFSDQNKANQQPSSTVKNLQASSLLEVPSTLNGPSGLLIGERNSSKRTSTITRSNVRHQAKSNIKGSKPSSKPYVSSTLNGSSGLLIRERNVEHQPGLLQQTTKVFATQRCSHESSKTNDRSARDIASEQFPALPIDHIQWGVFDKPRAAIDYYRFKRIQHLTA